MISDSHPEIEAFQFQLLREAPSWRKANMLGQMFQTMKELAYQGLRQRYPDAGESELRRRLAGVILGEELAEQVYGPLLIRDS